MEIRYQYQYEFVNYIEKLPMKCAVVGIDSLIHHWHKDVEIIFVINGTVRFYIEDKDYILEKGDIILVNSYAVHAFQKMQGSNMFIFLQFDPGIYESIFSRSAKVSFHCNSKNANETQQKAYNQLKKKLAEIGSEIYLKRDGFQFYIKSCLFRIVGQLFRDFKYDISNHEEQKIQLYDLDRLKHIIEYVNNCYFENLSLDSMAKHENMSVSYFNHYFKNRTGISFYRYLNLVRIEKAKELLRKTNYTNDRIAAECGFKNTNSMYRLFRNILGITPAACKTDNDCREEFMQNPMGYTIINPLAGLELLYEYLDI